MDHLDEALDPAHAVEQRLLGTVAPAPAAHEGDLVAAAHLQLVRDAVHPAHRALAADRRELQFAGAVHGFRGGAERAAAGELQVDLDEGVAVRRRRVDEGEPAPRRLRPLAGQEQHQVHPVAGEVDVGVEGTAQDRVALPALVRGRRIQHRQLGGRGLPVGALDGDQLAQLPGGDHLPHALRAPHLAVAVEHGHLQPVAMGARQRAQLVQLGAVHARRLVQDEGAEAGALRFQHVAGVQPVRVADAQQRQVVAGGQSGEGLPAGQPDRRRDADLGVDDVDDRERLGDRVPGHAAAHDERCDLHAEPRRQGSRFRCGRAACSPDPQAPTWSVPRPSSANRRRRPRPGSGGAAAGPAGRRS